MPKPHHVDIDKTPMSDSSQKFDLTTEEGRKTALTITQIPFPYFPSLIGLAKPYLTVFPLLHRVLTKERLQNKEK